ncbi:hypothetical protein IWW56_003048 [Coemansia sp. RSA 2131]|nr:hypothetical protein IWW56_003048 [Coemansia sp. RSA 2131]
MSECRADTDNTQWDQNAHIVALFAVVGASAVGVFLPIIGQTIRGLHQMSVPVFPIQMGQFFGAGVIVATAFLHLLPAANDALTSSCLDGFADRYGAWACLFALAAVFTMHSVEWWLVEAWVGRTNSDLPDHGLPMFHGANNNIDDNTGDSNPGNTNDDGGQLYPAYSRAFNASRMILAPPVLSPPVNPYVFGTSTMSRRANAADYDGLRGAFALTRHGNYAALVQSRQQLALVQSDRASRYMGSDPQFSQYEPSVVWPVPSGALAMHGASQAKSTPELMRRMPRSQGVSRGSSTASNAHNTQSSHAVSLRPDSFSNAAKRQRRTRQSAVSWKLQQQQRCLSMPRLPPTTLDACLYESLLEPLPTKSRADVHTRTSVSPRSQQSSRPISVALAAAAAKRESKRMSLQAFAALSLAVKRSSAGPSDATSPSVLDPVPEMDDTWVTSESQHRESNHAWVTSEPLPRDSDDASAVQVFASATSAMPRPSDVISRQQTFHTTQTHKRVSIPTPHVIRAAPSSCAFRSVNIEQNATNRVCVDPVQTVPSKDQADDSTAIQSRSLSLEGSQLSVPVDVKRRALATYILELGIALYSVLIGLALAISDSGFVALFVAICVHQFFEGLALGTSLAELYWIKAQLAAHRRCDDELNAAADLQGESPRHETIASERSLPHHAINISRPITTPDMRSNAASEGVCSEDFEYVSPTQPHRHSKSRRTVTSMATSFAPEPWLVNPQLEKTIAGAHVFDHRGASTTQPPDTNDAEAKLSPVKDRLQRPRYLVPRNTPERLPGWWKAWLSALAFCATTPTGIIIGLALHNVYEPHSPYALLLNGVLQSICTGVLVYAGLVTLVIGGFNSPQVKQLPRLLQVLLFFAVYAGAAVMAGLKIWK